MVSLKRCAAVVRVAVMLGLVGPVLLGGVLAKGQSKSTLAGSVARNDVDMMPVGGIRPAVEAKRPPRHARKP